MKYSVLKYCQYLVFFLFTVSLNGQSEKEGEFLNYEYEENSGKLFLFVPGDFGQFIYVNYLSAGLGSNDIGLDRGQIGDTRLVQFEKYGNKLLLIEDNLDYRAISDNPLEAKSVKEAFARSTIEAFTIIENKNDVYKIEITSFIVSDAHGVVQNLKRQKQGNYKFSANRSVVDPSRCKSFPKNTEFEAIVTFEGEAPGRNLRSVVADSGSFTLGVHHSFVALPDDQYKPRKFHAASGYFPMMYQDYAVPIERDITQRFIYRHRLEKKNPDQAVSEPVEPIVYYIDAGCPEPIKSALMDGASWWNEAFEAAGFTNAFQIKELPEGADPLDVRYNMIQWVHRSTRGWSYGAMVADPRTGEIIKGHVSLGSLRVRQDYLIMQGLLSPFDDNWSWDDENPMKEIALARLRQLAAHEVGHTIGLAHNFAASSQNRASVMDYPHPQLFVENNKINYESAYDTAIGIWDKQAIKYGYQLLSREQSEEDLLQSIIAENNSMNLRYITDADARPVGGAHSSAHLWDNGESAIKEFSKIRVVRMIALQNFGSNSIPDGTPYSELEKVFTPIYMLHRYQVEALAKLVGGYDYNYSVKNSGSEPLLEPTSSNDQREAYALILQTLKPRFLDVSPSLNLILPNAPGYGRSRESFKGNMGPMFDPIEPAVVSSHLSLALLLNPERLNRVQMLHTNNPEYMSLAEYLEGVDATIKQFSGDYMTLHRYLFLTLLMEVQESAKSSASTKEDIYLFLRRAKRKMGRRSYWSYMIKEYFKNGSYPQLSKEIKTPPGSPIGCGH